MGLLFLIFAAFKVFFNPVLGCQIPFNDVSLIGNATHSSDTLIEAAYRNGKLEGFFPNPATGWHDVVSNPLSYFDPWPPGVSQSGSRPLIVVKYCFADDAIYNLFPTLVRDAWNVWYLDSGLGIPSEQNGHRLWFNHAPLPDNTNKDNKSCYLKDGRFNTIFPPETVMILAQPYGRAGASSTTGYIPKSKNPIPYRHRMWLGAALATHPFGKSVIAHEIGHILGLIREHQRADRDHYVAFQCHNLRGYAEMKIQVEMHPKRPGDTIDLICYNPAVAKLYNFASADYTIGGLMQGTRFEFRTHGSVYDLDSIMHYGSTQFAQHWPEEVDSMPLVKWQARGPNFDPKGKVPTPKNADPIWEAQKPSRLDVERLKWLYPWDPRRPSK
ncbi:hypothetical protein M011DRAFT_458970 [Sporormia fimetaria CBS 119925]|uniref:Metalloendopeptidase n=1 Tax=Sporormia fimetaria CBS 119925 TaxID=1340428 RepID=A0A6A6V8W4_9PLEO|nr:hypothetical protein M011DRAFT_458970 [Sporormia fimetaria CBS 119925]